MVGGTTSAVALAGAAVALLATVCVGTVVHELAHAAALRAVGLDCDVEWFPADGGGPLGGGLAAAWATVRPCGRADAVSPLALRVAALAPLAMTLPVGLAVLGLTPDPTGGGDPIATAIVIGWLACAIPSPQDFSLVWYPRRALRDVGAEPR